LYLTPEEQEFVELLTDKLIEVAHNPKLRDKIEFSYPVEIKG
jgi:hypothetical protein